MFCDKIKMFGRSLPEPKFKFAAKTQNIILLLLSMIMIQPRHASAEEVSDSPGFELGNLKCPRDVVRRSAEDHGGGGHGIESTPAPPAVLYLPLGGSGRPSCLPSAGAKLAQLVSRQLFIS